MKFISTNGIAPSASLKDAVHNCLAPDGGLYVPENIPLIPQAYLNNISGMSLRDIAYVVSTAFFGDSVSASDIKNIADDSFRFEAPLHQIDDEIYAMELFHGPTLTVKDYGAGFFGRFLQLLGNGSDIRRNVLVATTGNTGAAVANGLSNKKDINVFVLYPQGRLSRMAIAQFTSLGDNIHPLEVMGTVEDCKRMMLEAINDSSLKQYNLTGANSINIARLIPLVSLAFNAYARLVEKGRKNVEKTLLSIPCGNLSLLVAAVIAKRMGLNIGRLIAATNTNDVITHLLKGEPVDRNRAPLKTLASSIDMGYPTGWPRLLHLYRSELDDARKEIITVPAISDETIAQTICSLKASTGYTLDPQGAVGYAAAKSVGKGSPAVVYATGHPAKQLDVMTKITGSAIELPLQLIRFMSVRRHPDIIPPTLAALKRKIAIHN